MYLSPITVPPQPLVCAKFGRWLKYIWHCHGQELRRASSPPTMRANDTEGSILGTPQPAASTATESCHIGTETVPIQLAQCWFPALAIFSAKI